MFRCPDLRTMSPAWFRARVLPASHNSWNAAEANILASSMERRRIEELEIELAGAGFERPVVLERDHWWSLRPRVCDGMHRSIAAMRLGIAIPTRCGFPTEDEYDHEDIYRIAAAETNIDDLVDAALSLSSFRCSAGPWIQCDVATGAADGPVHIRLPRHPQLRGLIAAELRDRFATAGFEADVTFLGDSED